MLLLSFLLEVPFIVPRKHLDLVPVDPHIRASKYGVAFAHHVSELHKYIHDRITQQNAAYKQAADSHCHHRSFKVGDQVMVRLTPERYSPGTTTKLHAHSAGPFRVLSRMGENAYIVDITPLWGISSTFNVTDLAAYLALPPHDQPSDPGPFFESEFAQQSTPPVLPPDWHEQVEEVLQEIIDFTGDGASRRFFVHWQGCLAEDDVWITEDDLPRLRPDLLEALPDTPANSMKSSSSEPGRIGGVQPPSPPRHDTTAPEEPTPARVQPPRQANTKDVDFHYIVQGPHLATTRHTLGSRACGSIYLILLLWTSLARMCLSGPLLIFLSPFLGFQVGSSLFGILMMKPLFFVNLIFYEHVRLLVVGLKWALSPLGPIWAL